MRWLAAGSAFVLGFAVAAGQPPQHAGPPPVEQKVLDRFVGTWTTTFTVPEAEWTPKARNGTAKVQVARVLGGAFVQEQHANGDGTSGQVLRTYDAERKAYRGWVFMSNGQSQESTGTWNARSLTFTWTAKEKAGTSTLVQRFLDADTIDWDLSIKGGGGAEVFRMEGRTTRMDAKK